MQKKYYNVLTIAGSDSGGGAGIQADLKTFSALGTFGMSVITALTAQNTLGVQGVFPVEPAFIGKQIESIFEDMRADAVKIGMLHSPEVIQVVVEKLKYYGIKNIVLDPVMIAKSGDKLLQAEAIDALKKELIPIATIITPNIPEAEVLSNQTIDTYTQMTDIAHDLAIQLHTEAVLLKGGHFQEEEAYSTDILYLRDTHKIVDFKEDRIDTENTHGTGCTLSSAIAAYLAKGIDLENAVAEAKKYITQAIKEGADYRLGKGYGPVKHFWNFW